MSPIVGCMYVLIFALMLRAFLSDLRLFQRKPETALPIWVPLTEFAAVIVFAMFILQRIVFGTTRAQVLLLAFALFLFFVGAGVRTIDTLARRRAATRTREAAR